MNYLALIDSLRQGVEALRNDAGNSGTSLLLEQAASCIEDLLNIDDLQRGGKS